MSFVNEQPYTITAADATSATLSHATGANPNEHPNTPSQVVITWPSASKKPAKMIVGATVTVRVQA